MLFEKLQLVSKNEFERIKKENIQLNLKVAQLESNLELVRHCNINSEKEGSELITTIQNIKPLVEQTQTILQFIKSEIQEGLKINDKE